MCLTIDKKFETLRELVSFARNPMRATEDMTVFKRLTVVATSKYGDGVGLLSPHIGHWYRQGERCKIRMRSYFRHRFKLDTEDKDFSFSFISPFIPTIFRNNLKEELWEWEMVVHQGFHAYANLEAGEKDLSHNLNVGQTLIKCTIPKGTKYFLGKGGEVVSNEIVIGTRDNSVAGYSHKPNVTMRDKNEADKLNQPS